MPEYIVYTTPPDAEVVLLHDTNVRFVGVPAPDVAPDAQRIIIAGVPDGQGAQLTITHKDQITIEQHGVLWLTRGSRAEFAVDVFRMVPRPFEAPALPRLVTRGQFFAKDNGEPFTAIECSDFALLARYAAGDDIRPVLVQRQELGFNMARVWTLMRLAQFGIGDLEPCPYDQIPAFCRFCARYGLYVEFTAYTGVNDPEHWSRLIAAVSGSTNVILELVNELDQNTNEPDSQGRVFRLGDYAQAPAPLLSAHGSNGSQAQPVLPHWAYATFHTNGASEEVRKVGHNAMEIWNGPTLTNETSRFPDNARSTTFAFDAAAGASLLCAGSCFHSVHGKSSQLFEGVELDGARAWVAGARSVALACQPGSYRHRDDLEGPNELRVYQRGRLDACIVRIRR